MGSEENVEIIKNMFTAFEKGNIPCVLNMLAADVKWQSPVTSILDRDTVTWARPRKGHKEVAAFFNELVEKMIPEPFEVLGFTSQGDRVIVEGRNGGSIRKTGKRYEHNWIMVLELFEGKITSCRHYYDLADLVAAF